VCVFLACVCEQKDEALDAVPQDIRRRVNTIFALIRYIANLPTHPSQGPCRIPLAGTNGLRQPAHT
jgi:hypothetical protein